MRVVVLAVAVLLGTMPAWAAPPEAAHALVVRWAAAFNAGKAADVASLYTPDATLWGTVTPQLEAQPAAITAYFAAAARSGLKVRLMEHRDTEVADGVVVEAGRYEFERSRDGKKQYFPARYSFVLLRKGGEWRIAHQHSSPLPKAQP